MSNREEHESDKECFAARFANVWRIKTACGLSKQDFFGGQPFCSGEMLEEVDE